MEEEVELIQEAPKARPGNREELVSQQVLRSEDSLAEYGQETPSLSLVKTFMYYKTMYR